ncbi:MAG TPA: AAA family ATPase [Thermoleophilaceae bacterium]|nr:AAA family ATPase [Thermoleophilaceae bacterium]
MRIPRRSADELAANRNLSAAVLAIAAALAGLAQAAGAPVAVRIVLAAIGLVGAFVGLGFHLLERRAAARGFASPTEVRRVPRSDLDHPTKFVNRADELARLDELLDRAERGQGPVVAVLGGLPGVGKSAVGRYWANRIRERFVDGDLVANFSERRRGAAVDVSGYLAEFIRKLGPPDAVVPATLAERVERFRSMTFDRQLLVLLDDVAEAAEVTQLRPSGNRSLVLATSYRTLEELHYGGAELLPVDPLPADRAEDLLVEMAGDFGSEFEHDQDATERLVAFCGGLALPLCVCAARVLLGRGSRTVASVVAEVSDEDRRLSYLAGKGEYAGAAVFGFAYGDLPPEQRLAYRRVAIHPGLNISAVHTAVLAGIGLDDAAEKLAALADTYLLQPLEDGRYRFHDLVRLHARETTAREDADATREETLSGLVDWYRASLRRADRALIADRLRLAPDDAIAAPHLPTFADRDSAFDWLEAERANTLAVLQSARDREWDDRVWQMVESLWLFHYNRRHYADWIDASEIGVECARRAGDRDAEARMRAQLAWALAEVGRPDAARAELERANRLVADSANDELRASVREFTGACALKEGEYDHALDAFRYAREIFSRTGNERGVALQDFFIGSALLGKASYDEALATLRAALVTMRRIDDQMFVGRLLLRIGEATLEMGDTEGAEAALQEALRFLVELGMRVEEAETYDQLAAVADARKDRKTAAARRERAQAIYRALGHPSAGEPVAAGPPSAVDALTL